MASGSVMASRINSLAVDGETLVWHTGLPREGEQPRTSPPFSYGGREWCLRFWHRDEDGDYHTIRLHRLDANGYIEESYKDLTDSFEVQVQMLNLTEDDEVVGNVEDCDVCETPRWLWDCGWGSYEDIFEELDWLRDRPEVKFACRFPAPPTIIPTDEDRVIKELESLKGEIYTLQRTVQEHGLESENFKRAAGEYRRRLEDKMTVLNSRLKKATADKGVQVSSVVPRDIEPLSNDLSLLLEKELLPDVRLECGGRTFRAHRSVLAARSDVFRAMFQNETSESQTGDVKVQDMDVGVLQELLRFLYSGRPEDISEDNVSQLYEAADKYAVMSLKAACAYRIERHLAAENCVGYLVLADSHSDRDLKAAVISFIIGNPDVLKSSEWLLLSKQLPALAVEVFQAYFS